MVCDISWAFQYEQAPRSTSAGLRGTRLAALYQDFDFRAAFHSV